MEVSIQLLDDSSFAPVRFLPGDAAYDIRATQSGVLAPRGGRLTVGSGFAIALPLGYAGLILPRSGLASQHGVTVLNAPGLVDSGYRGEVKLILLNTGESEFHIARGDRVAQLLIIAIEDAAWIRVEDLPSSTRDAQGLGHSGR
jgi:dUTP pyrophosphatase